MLILKILKPTSTKILTIRQLSTTPIRNNNQPIDNSNVVEASESRTAASRLERLLILQDKFSKGFTKPNIPISRFRAALYPSSGDSITQPITNLPPPLSKHATKKMLDSYVELDLLFSTDSTLREQYVGGLSKVRMGRLMEDFDTIAGSASYKHCLPVGVGPGDAKNYGFYLVTASVDRMDLLRPLEDSKGEVKDLRLSGFVSYATESSMEVLVTLSTIPSTLNERPETILVGKFAMAARKIQGGKHLIPKLLIEGPEEQELWENGQEAKKEKLKRSKISLEKNSPTIEEAAIMHRLFVGRSEIFERNAPTPKEVVWMSSTKLRSALLMHPQERNVHGKVFGGFLMRLAFETAYSTACLFSRSAVNFLALDELRFALPVEIGSLLILDSRVSFVPTPTGEHKSFHVSVEAGTTNLYTGQKQITNVFHFTFTSDKPLERYVLPRSYKQSMLWLDAIRRREVGISVRKQYQ